MSSESEIDRVPVQELQGRYSIGKTALYARLNALNIEPTKDGRRSYVSGEQLEQLDRLDEELKRGGVLPAITESKPVRETSGELIDSSSPNAFTLDIPQLAHLGEILEQLSAKLTQQDPTARYRYLYYFADNRISIPTSTVKALTGKQPTGQTFCWSGFKFDRLEEKIGRERAWLVSKRHLGN